MINSLKNLSAAKLRKNDVLMLSDMSIDMITLAHINPLIQLEVNGYSFKTDGRRITTYSIIDKTSVQIVVYNDDNSNLDQLKEQRTSYPVDEKSHKYCGSISTETILYPVKRTGTYCEYKNQKLYRIIDLRQSHPMKKVSMDNILSICSLKWIMSGTFRQLYSNGHTEVLGHFANNGKHGDWKSYYPSSQEYKRNIKLSYRFYNNVQVGWQEGCDINGRQNMGIGMNEQVIGWFSRRVEHPEFDKYRASIRDGVISHISFYLNNIDVYPNDTNVDLLPEQICDPILINEKSLQLI